MNKRRNYLNKKHLPRTRRPGLARLAQTHSDHTALQVSPANMWPLKWLASAMLPEWSHVSSPRNAKAHNVVCPAIAILRQLQHITPPPSPQAPCEAVPLSSFVLPVPYWILLEASLAPLLLPASPLLPQSPSSPTQTVSPTGTGALV